MKKSQFGRHRLRLLRRSHCCLGCTFMALFQDFLWPATASGAADLAGLRQEQDLIVSMAHTRRNTPAGRGRAHVPGAANGAWSAREGVAQVPRRQFSGRRTCGWGTRREKTRRVEAGFQDAWQASDLAQPIGFAAQPLPKDVILPSASNLWLLSCEADTQHGAPRIQSPRQLRGAAESVFSLRRRTTCRAR